MGVWVKKNLIQTFAYDTDHHNRHECYFTHFSSSRYNCSYVLQEGILRSAVVVWERHYNELRFNRPDSSVGKINTACTTWELTVFYRHSQYWRQSCRRSLSEYRSTTTYFTWEVYPIPAWAVWRVVIVTKLQAARFWFVIPVGKRDFSFLGNVQTDSGTHSFAYAMGREGLSEGLQLRGVTLTTHIHVVLSLEMDLNFHSPHTPS
jgi:hypothetical protein